MLRGIFNKGEVEEMGPSVWEEHKARVQERVDKFKRDRESRVGISPVRDYYIPIRYEVVAFLHILRGVSYIEAEIQKTPGDIQCYLTRHVLHELLCHDKLSYERAEQTLGVQFVLIPELPIPNEADINSVEYGPESYPAEVYLEYEREDGSTVTVGITTCGSWNS